MVPTGDTSKLPIAKTLREVPGVLSAQPLFSDQQLISYRVEDTDEIRGQGVVDQLYYNLVELPPHLRPCSG
jgi:hypothetical protein